VMEDLWHYRGRACRGRYSAHKPLGP
jgi:hypothetical protein